MSTDASTAADTDVAPPRPEVTDRRTVGAVGAGHARSDSGFRAGPTLGDGVVDPATWTTAIPRDFDTAPHVRLSRNRCFDLAWRVRSVSSCSSSQSPQRRARATPHRNTPSSPATGARPSPNRRYPGSLEGQPTTAGTFQGRRGTEPSPPRRRATPRRRRMGRDERSREPPRPTPAAARHVSGTGSIPLGHPQRRRTHLVDSRRPLDRARPAPLDPLPQPTPTPLRHPPTHLATTTGTQHAGRRRRL